MTVRMSRETALGYVCAAALEWAREYGFVHSDAAENVVDAIEVLCPELLEENK